LIANLRHAGETIGGPGDRLLFMNQQENSMARPDRPEVVDQVDAKAGTREGVVRWVLGISFALAIAALTLIWVTGALTQGPVESQQNVQRKVEAEREQRGDNDSSIDGVLVDDPGVGAPGTSTER